MVPLLVQIGEEKRFSIHLARYVELSLVVVQMASIKLFLDLIALERGVVELLNQFLRRNSNFCFWIALQRLA